MYKFYSRTCKVWKNVINMVAYLFMYFIKQFFPCDYLCRYILAWKKGQQRNFLK